MKKMYIRATIRNMKIGKDKERMFLVVGSPLTMKEEVLKLLNQNERLVSYHSEWLR